METLDQMRAHADAQEAYGKWNTAPLRNAIARLEDAQRGPLVRAVRRTCGYAVLIVACGLVYGPIVLSIVNMFVRG